MQLCILHRTFWFEKYIHVCLQSCQKWYTAQIYMHNYRLHMTITPVTVSQEELQALHKWKSRSQLLEGQLGSALDTVDVSTTYDTP